MGKIGAFVLGSQMNSKIYTCRGIPSIPPSPKLAIDGTDQQWGSTSPQGEDDNSVVGDYLTL